MNSVIVAVAALAALLTAVPSTSQSVSRPGPPPAAPLGAPITLSVAVRAAQSAITRAAEIGVPSAIAVVEPSGELVYFAKMEGAPYSATLLAQQKAAAAARYRRPTQAFFDGIEAGHLFFLTFPGVAGAPGGLPLVVDGKLVGAIGVSGGNGDQDNEIAGAGTGGLK